MLNLFIKLLHRDQKELEDTINAIKKTNKSTKTINIIFNIQEFYNKESKNISIDTYLARLRKLEYNLNVNTSISLAIFTGIYLLCISILVDPFGVVINEVIGDAAPIILKIIFLLFLILVFSILIIIIFIFFYFLFLRTNKKNNTDRFIDKYEAKIIEDIITKIINKKK